MNICPICKKGALRASSVLRTVELGDERVRQPFSKKLRGLRCGECGETFVDGPALLDFETTVVKRLAKEGFSSGAALRFVRKAAGVKAADVAELFGVSLQTVSAWETGKHPADNATRAMVASLALDELEGTTTTRDRLMAMQHAERSADVSRLGRAPALAKHAMPGRSKVVAVSRAPAGLKKRAHETA